MNQLAMQVIGQVQGVAFRAHTQRVAQGLGLTGWVRNEPDGSVQLVAEGSQAALETLVAWVERGGPPRAVVAHSPRQWGPATGAFADFVITQ